MTYDAETFMQEAGPIANFFHSLAEGYYWVYEGNRDQRISPDVYTADGEPNVEDYFGLNLTECSGRKLWDNLADIEEHVLYHIVQQAVDNREQLLNFFRGAVESEEEHVENSFRNLTNGWRDEYGLNEPLDGDYERRMKTPEWRIIQCYYSVLKSVCAVLYTKKDTLVEGHDGRINTFANEFMDSDARVLFTYPFKFFPDSDKGDKYASSGFLYPQSFTLDEDHEYYETLVEDRREEFDAEQRSHLGTLHNQTENITNWNSNVDDYTFYHSLMLCREWANYQHGGVFCRLYGDGHKKAIDAGVRISSFTALTIAEVSLICAYGFETFQNRYREYVDACSTAVEESSSLVQQRFKVYRRAFQDF